MKYFLICIGVIFNTTNSFALKDPMIPLEMQTNGKNTYQKNKLSATGIKVYYTLYSTIISDTRRLADINGKLVSEGDRVNGATVRKIDPNHVVIMTKGETKVLSVSTNKGIKTTK